MVTIPLLSDAQWAVLEPLLPPVKGRMGRPMRDHRPVVEGAIYRLKAGIPWRYLPPQFGAWQTVHRRHQAWSADGTWDRVLARLQSSHTGGSVEQLTAGVGVGLSRADDQDKRFGRTGESPADRATRSSASSTRSSTARGGSGPGRPRTTPTCLRGDKAYSSRGHRSLLRSRGITAVIPERADQAGHRKNRGSRSTTVATTGFRITLCSKACACTVNGAEARSILQH